MESHFPPIRGWRWWIAAAILTIVVAVAAHVGLTRRIEHRVATGQRVSGTVTVVTRLPFGSQVRSRRFTVTYDFRGHRSARVNDAFADGDFHVGDRLTLYVDPAHPDRVALADGQAGEGLILLLPPFVVELVTAWLISLVGVRMRWWRRFGRGRPVDVSLLELVTTYESDEALQWKGAERPLRVAVEAASVPTSRSWPSSPSACTRPSRATAKGDGAVRQRYLAGRVVSPVASGPPPSSGHSSRIRIRTLALGIRGPIPAGGNERG
jgi:hypothetical protein